MLNTAPSAEHSARVCQELQAHLSEFLDNDLEQAVCAQVQAHLRECPGCRAMLNTMQKTIVLYHALAPEPMPDAARARLYRALHLAELPKASNKTGS